MTSQIADLLGLECLTYGGFRELRSETGASERGQGRA